MVSSFNLFDLSRWKLTLPVDSLNGILGRALDIRDIVDFRDARYFYVGTDGGMTLSAPVDGATTPGSTHSRSEMRELDSNGNDAAWNLKLGGTMTATLCVNWSVSGLDLLPAKMVIGQIHGVSKELIRLYYQNGNVYFSNDQTGANNKEGTYYLYDAAGKMPDIAAGEKFSYKIDAHGSTLAVTVYTLNDVFTQTISINSVWQSDTLYFKAGMYLGVNETEGSGVGTAEFYGLDSSHVAGQGLGGLADLSVPADAVALDGTLLDDVLRGGDGGDRLNGYDGNDVVNGSTGTDNLWGGNGNDWLNGGGGGDSLCGGDGNDTYIVDNLTDIVNEYFHLGLGGTDTVNASISYVLPLSVENLVLTGTANIDGTGNALDNTIFGNVGANHLDGGDGRDTLIGGKGDDTYYLHSGDKIVEYTGGGRDVVYSDVSCTLSDNIEYLTLTDTARTGIANVLDNHLTGNSYANTLNGMAGNDLIDGGAGGDAMTGGAGNDTFMVDNSSDQTIENGNEGHDIVRATASFVLGDNVEDLYFINALSVDGTGNALGNIIVANAGVNHLDGGLGNDTITGRGGNDQFIFDTNLGAGNVDIITDFTVNRDQLVLDHLIFDQLGIGHIGPSSLCLGSTAQTADQHLIYNRSTGALYYDADGSGDAAQIAFATLSSKPVLTYVDFLVV